MSDVMHADGRVSFSFAGFHPHIESVLNVEPF